MDDIARLMPNLRRFYLEAPREPDIECLESFTQCQELRSVAIKLRETRPSNSQTQHIAKFISQLPRLQRFALFTGLRIDHPQDFAIPDSLVPPKSLEALAICDSYSQLLSWLLKNTTYLDNLTLFHMYSTDRPLYNSLTPRLQYLYLDDSYLRVSPMDLTNATNLLVLRIPQSALLETSNSCLQNIAALPKLQHLHISDIQHEVSSSVHLDEMPRFLEMETGFVALKRLSLSLGEGNHLEMEKEEGNLRAACRARGIWFEWLVLRRAATGTESALYTVA